jgi:phage terminase large subunit
MQETKIACTSVFEKNYHNHSPIVVNVGGVRSSKSYSIAQCINAYALEFPGLAIGICRKVASTLTGSVVRPFIKVAQEFDIWQDANFNKSERYYVYDLGDGNPTKSTIQFFGLDDIEKIKSTEFNLIWMEEATGFSYEDFTFLQTRLSAPKPEGWQRNQIVLSLNPGDARGWIRTQLLPQEGVALIESTYKDNPFLSADYVRSIMAMKETNPRMYKMLVLNQWGVSEGRVFDKWELYDDSTAPEEFDQIVYGLDFGWNHATALIECSFRDNEVYLKEIIYKNHINNGELIALMDAVGVNKNLAMIADSAEPDRIDEIFAKGYQRVEGIKKIEVVKTINILQNYKIYIHKDSKNLQSEFDEYEWKKNLAGQYLDKLEPDKQHDDAIAAVRYATQYFDENAGTKSFYA